MWWQHVYEINPEGSHQEQTHSKCTGIAHVSDTHHVVSVSLVMYTCSCVYLREGSASTALAFATVANKLANSTNCLEIAETRGIPHKTNQKDAIN